MKLSTAVATRIGRILNEKDMSQRKLEEISGLSHNTVKTLMGERNKGVNLRIIIAIIRSFGMTAAEFFDDPIFERDDLEID